MCNVGYVRVSTDEQRKRGYSVDGQKQEIESMAERNEEKIETWYVDDGYSGTNVHRPELKKMLKDCSRGMIRKIYIVDSDRLTRVPVHRYSFNKVFSRFNVTVVSNSFDWDTSTFQGSFSGDIKTLTAYYEVSQVRPRTLRGLKESARQGNYSKGGRAPRGYIRVKNPASSKSGTKLDKKEGYGWEKIIPRIFTFIAYSIDTTRSLARKLDKERAGGMRWDENAVVRIIRNPIYWGCFASCWYYQENHQPAYVTKELAELANSSLDSVTKTRKYDYVYGGLVKCADCGCWTRNDVTVKVRKNIKKKSSKRVYKIYKYYECPNCLKRINENKLHCMVYPRLRAEWKKKPQDLELYLELQEKEKRLFKRKDILNHDYDNNLISDDDYEQERKEILKNIKKIKAQIKKADKEYFSTFFPLSELEKRSIFQKYYCSLEYSYKFKTINLFKLNRSKKKN